MPLPPTLTEPIQRYLDHYRPELLARATTLQNTEAFWISAGGKPLPAKQIGQLVSRGTKRELGRDLNPHLFRKMIPTELTIRDPEHVGIARAMLGHADYRITQQAYNLGCALDAARRHQEVTRSIRTRRERRRNPPQPAPVMFRKEEPLRAVIYARYSSDQQRDSSIEDQIRLCRQRIAQEGWDYQHAYTDRAISGASALRPAYQALLEDTRRGQFDIVVAEALDRLSRDQEDVAGLLKRLRFAGVRLFTLSEGEIGELHIGLKGTMNALFLKDLADKTRRGLEGRVRQGRSGGGLCFGYDLVREHDARGEPIHGGRAVNKAEAAITRRIFAEFASGKSPRRIAVDLNRDGVPGPRGGQWDASTINGNASRGTGILNNELYIGRLVWNRLRYVKDPASGKRISRMNDMDRWIVQAVPELRIIEQQLWDRVKERQRTLKRNTRPDLADKPFWDRHRPRFLITGLAKCGACGSSYVKISRNLFGCAAARNRGTCGNRLNIRLETLEEMILAGLRERLMAPELFKVFCEEFHREVNRQRAEDNAAADSKRHELDKVERRIRRIVELITEDDAPARALKQELVALEARQEALHRELGDTTAPAPLIHPNLAAVYRQQVEQLHEALHNPATRDEAFELIRSLIDEIRLMPDQDALRVELKGELAGILALAADKKKPGDRGAAGLAEQIKMVAGTRNHREFIRVIEI